MVNLLMWSLTSVQRILAQQLRRCYRMALITCFALLTGCPEEDEESCWCVPDVAAVRIRPSSFSIQPGSTFELEARLYRSNGTEIPEFFAYTPHWTVSSGSNVQIVSRHGHTVVLHVPEGVTVAEFEVVAEAGLEPGVASAPATGVVVRTQSTDYISAEPSVADQPLSIALATDATGPNPWDAATPVAFSGFAQLGPLSGLGEFIVLSSTHAMASDKVNWVGPRDYVRNQNGTGYGEIKQQDTVTVLKKGLTIWIDPVAADDQWPATTAEAMIQVLLADANRTLRRNRVGVEFFVRGIHRITSGSVPQVDPNCSPWSSSITGVRYSGGAESQFSTSSGTGTLNDVDVFVAYIGDLTGRSCRDAGPPERFRVYINASLTQPEVLGHELGHVMLNPSAPSQDHHDAAPLGATNLLVQGEDYPGSLHRTRVSVGQACRMNNSAIVKELRGLASLPTPASCPPVTRDVP